MCTTNHPRQDTGLMLGLEPMYHENVVQKFLVSSINTLLMFEQKDFVLYNLLLLGIFVNENNIQ